VERLFDEVKERYPQARVAVLSSDTLAGPTAIRALIEQIEKGEIDLLIGTQMIAKGYHFPSLTLVGVVDGDMGLAGSDPRASERTFQLLSQVAGRSGRGEKKGQVLIQSHMPDHAVMKALISGDRDLFLATEAEERQAFGLPPYGRLASVILSGKNALEVETLARQLARHIPTWEGEVWGPAPAPLHLIRGKYRWRFLIKSLTPPQGFISTWLATCPCPRSIQLQIDIDPCSFL
jgi:primosomal protein N' (replication factor Y)